MLLAGGGAMSSNGELVWNDDQSWAFPVLPVEDNGDKLLIDCGKIVTDVAVSVSDNPASNDQLPKGKKTAKRSAAADEGKVGGGESADDHELHIWTERERRKKMRNMFASLQALIPHLHPRADKSTTIDEAVVYIKHLQQVLDILEQRKQQLEKGSNNANATGCDAAAAAAAAVVAQSREAFMADQGGPGLMPVGVAGPSNGGRAAFKTWNSPNVVLNVCGLEAHINIACGPNKPGVLTALLLLMDRFNLDVVSAHVSSGPTSRIFMVHLRANAIPQQFPEAEFLAEEAYKQVAAELIIWINS